MKKKAITYIISTLRLAVISLILLSMVATIAVPCTAVKKPAPVCQPKDEISTQTVIIPGSQTTPEESGKFGPGKKQPTTQRLIAVEPILSKQDNQSRQLQLNKTDQNIFTFQCAADEMSSQPICSPSFVSTHLGRLLTLVGSRPSGTM